MHDNVDSAPCELQLSDAVLERPREVGGRGADEWYVVPLEAGDQRDRDPCSEAQRLRGLMKKLWSSVLVVGGLM